MLDFKLLYQSIDDKNLSHELNIPTDICLSVNDKKIHCHRIVLCCRSTYFRSLLGQSWNQKYGIRSDYHLDNVDYKALKLVVEFLYTDDVNVNWKYAVDVLELADKFCIERLKFICEDAIAQAVNDDNVVELLSISYRYT